METNGFDIFFQEDDEDYIDDPISLLDFEEDTVFSGSEKYLKNITIEDPGYVVSISLEDYELRLQKSLSKLKELKTSRESSGYSNKNGYLLRQCRTCSIKVVDCNKFPWYYRNKLVSTNNIRHPNIENSVVEIGEKHKEEIEIIDLTENEQVECKNGDDNIIQEKNTNNIDKVKVKRTEFTSVNNSIDSKIRKQTYNTLFKPVLNFQNESHTKVPRKEVDQATDLIISTYTSLTDKAIQKLKTNIESCENSKNISHNLDKKILLDCKSLTNTREKIKYTKNDQKVAKASTNNINNDCKDAHHKRKNNKISNKLKSVYTSEQISKTKIKIKKSALKSKDIISNKRNKKEGKECKLILNATSREQYDSLKNIDKKHNLLNEKNQNREQNCNHQNKEERIQRNSYSYLSLPSPVLTTIITETKKSTSLPNQNNFNPDKMHGCNKQVFCADRTIQHFHDNAFLNLRDILSKTKSNGKHPKRSKDTISNYKAKKNKNRFDSKDLNLEPMVTQMTNRNIQRNNDYCVDNNNAMVNSNEPLKKMYNTNEDISNISTMNAVNPSKFTYGLPVNTGIILKRLTHPTPNILKENVNNIDLINQSKKSAAEEEERLRYLLPSNLPDSHIQNIFKL